MELEKQGFTVKVFQDELATSPAESDTFGKLVTWHRHYSFQEDGNKVFGEPSEFLAQAKAGEWLYLPVAMLNHSGITLYEGTGAHLCDPGGWDSGQVGYIYVTPERIRENFMVKRISRKVREQSLVNLRAELKEWTQYVEGDVYAYTVTGPDGEFSDSCGGFYGYEYACTEAAAALDDSIAHEHTEQTKVSACMAL